MARWATPGGWDLTRRVRARPGWSPWLVALLAAIALIAALIIGKAALSGDICWGEPNERVDEPWVDVPDGREGGTNEEAGCGGARLEGPGSSDLFSTAYGPAKTLAQSQSPQRRADLRLGLRRLPDISQQRRPSPTAPVPDGLEYPAGPDWLGE